ncbi:MULTISPECIES: hypothetical protein [Streptomyces]|uniref:Uncharacterized protein n=2 Tax=Streptomyces TaxID=1883 RepID=A0ABV9IR61_9ACTN
MSSAVAAGLYLRQAINRTPGEHHDRDLYRVFARPDANVVSGDAVDGVAVYRPKLHV